MPSTNRWRLLVAGVLLLAAAWWSTQLWQPSGNYGYRPDPEGTARFLAELDQPLFADAGRDAIAKRERRDTFLYRAVYEAHQAKYGRPWIVGRQGIGDCVSWGWAHGVYFSQAVDWRNGQLADPPVVPATESIYGGSRVEARGRPEGGGGWSDGSYGGAAARWCRDWGVIYRQPYDRVDLTTYSADRAKSWGNYGNGGQGDAGRLDETAKRHSVEHVALVKTFDEAAAAIESGYPVAVCSMVGFSSTRDADGFCRRQGTWAHCMCFVAVRYGSRPGLLCLNSWGPTYVRGPKWPDDMPEGSFWVDRSTADSMLKGGDSFAIGSVSGFGWRDLHHGEWLDDVQR
jgi:hypothetical protein